MAFVELEKKGAVGVITMNRPEALNALNDQVLRDLFNSALAALSNAVPQLVSLTSNLVSIVVTGVLALVFSIYMLSGKDRLLAQCRQVLRAYTPPKVCRMVLEVTALTAGTFTGTLYLGGAAGRDLGSLNVTGTLVVRTDPNGTVTTGGTVDTIAVAAEGTTVAGTGHAGLVCLLARGRSDECGI